MKWTETHGVETLRCELEGATVVFGSRLTGCSSAPYASLNVGLGSGDDPDLVATNRRLLSEAAGVDPASVVMAKQVHGVDVIEHPSPDASDWWLRGEVPDVEADGHITVEPGVALAVITADCAPIALSGSKGLCLLHCGWRGLAGGLASAAARQIGASAAVIGPAIGACCYEVGDEVSQHFDRLPGAISGGHLDLVAAARAQLEAAGVVEIQAVSACTACDEAKFFSHRRDGAQTGRQGTLAWLN